MHADKLSELCISDSAIQPLATFCSLFHSAQNTEKFVTVHRFVNVASLITSRLRESTTCSRLFSSAYEAPSSDSHPAFALNTFFRRPHLVLNMRRECGLFPPTAIVLYLSQAIHRHKFVFFFLSFYFLRSSEVSGQNFSINHFVVNWE